MEAAHEQIAVRPALPAGRERRTLAAAVGLLLLAGAATAVLQSYPLPSAPLLLAGGFALLGVLTLALARYEAAVALGFLLMGVVQVEPAPPDAVLAVVIAVALVTGRFDPGRVPLAVGGLLGVLIALNLLSALEAIDAAAAAGFFAITLYLAVFSVWLAGYVSSRGRARSVVLAYVVGAVGSALLGSLALLAPIPGREAFLLDGCCRAQALFKDPNVFGPFLVPAVLILMEELVRPRLFRRWRALQAIALAILALGVVFSFSRAAWLNLGVGLAVMLLALMARPGGGREARGVLAVAIAVGGIAFVTLVATGSLDFLSERASLQSYDPSRFQAQQTGAELAERFPLGVGPGQFDVLVPLASHNTYIRVLAEQGLLGLVTLLALVLVTLVLAGRNAVLGRDTHGLGSAALLGAWCGLLANSLFIDTLHWRHLWIVAALVWAGALRRPPAARR
jgi:O-antigen ligase